MAAVIESEPFFLNGVAEAVKQGDKETRANLVLESYTSVEEHHPDDLSVLVSGGWQARSLGQATGHDCPIDDPRTAEAQTMTAGPKTGMVDDSIWRLRKQQEDLRHHEEETIRRKQLAAASLEVILRSESQKGAGNVLIQYRQVSTEEEDDKAQLQRSLEELRPPPLGSTTGSQQDGCHGVSLVPAEPLRQKQQQHRGPLRSATSSELLQRQAEDLKLAQLQSIRQSSRSMGDWSAPLYKEAPIHNPEFGETSTGRATPRGAFSSGLLTATDSNLMHKSSGPQHNLFSLDSLGSMGRGSSGNRATPTHDQQLPAMGDVTVSANDAAAFNPPHGTVWYCGGHDGHIRCRRPGRPANLPTIRDSSTGSPNWEQQVCSTSILPVTARHRPISFRVRDTVGQLDPLNAHVPASSQHLSATYNLTRSNNSWPVSMTRALTSAVCVGAGLTVLAFVCAAYVTMMQNLSRDLDAIILASTKMN